MTETLLMFYFYYYLITTFKFSLGEWDILLNTNHKLIQMIGDLDPLNK